ncbi:MAG: FumA C-terminus/TtdB family hydratase beta subunit [Candidatus Bipolaricaulota bacterium]
MNKVLRTPLSEAEIRDLRVGETIYVTGELFTARDEAHRVLLDAAHGGERLPFRPQDLALFHCGPVVESRDGVWRVTSAGPTTSARMEMFEADFLDTYSTRLVIGKGGMGKKTLEALGRVGAVYTHFTGGAGALAARAIRRVPAVYWLEELGMPEAVWILEVEAFGPLTVTMDSHGGSLHEVVAARVEANLTAIRAEMSREA